MALQPGDPEAMQLYQIIGAPLLAVVQAEAQAAQVSAEFIKSVGFQTRPAAPKTEALPPATITAIPAAAGTPVTPAKPQVDPEKTLQDGGDMGDLKMAEFVIDRVDSFGRSNPHVVKVPVLSLFPIPLLQVKNAEFEFNIRILSRVPLQSSDVDDIRTGHSPSKDYLSPDRVELKGLLAPASGDRSSEMSMKVKIRMEQSDVPAGLTRLLSIMDQNVSATPAAALVPERPKE